MADEKQFPDMEIRCIACGRTKTYPRPTGTAEDWKPVFDDGWRAVGSRGLVLVCFDHEPPLPCSPQP